MRVLITTSGLGSRLGEFTNFTNKCLVSVGDKPVISHIIDLYPDDTTFVITLGHYGNLVFDYLHLAHPNRLFIFVKIDNFSGPGSSLAYSMLAAKSYLSEPFVYHASDTIVSAPVERPVRNWIAGFTGKDASNFASFDVFQNQVVQTHSKGMDNFDYVYVGITGILSYEAFWSELERLYEQNPLDSSLNDFAAITNLIAQGIRFELSQVTNWVDTGNIATLKLARDRHDNSLPTLEKNDESIYLVDNNVIKFFADKSVCKNRVARSKILEPVVPKIIGYSENFYKYEFIDGSVAPKILDVPLFEKLLLFLEQNLWNLQDSSDKTSSFYDTCFKFYFTKTQMRLASFFLKTGLEDQENSINGILVPKVSELLEHASMKSLYLGTPCRIHGDLILDNIIVTQDSFALIDWRHDFAGLLDIGDKNYDLAKLNHSLILNHDIILKGGFDLRIGDKEIFLDVKRSNTLIECQIKFFSFIESIGVSRKKTEMLTALIWLNMAPLHAYPFDRFLFYFGKYNLNRAILSDYDY